MTRKQLTWHRLDNGQLERAIILDFESFQVGPTVLAGVLADGQFEQVVFDRRLDLAARAKGLDVADLAGWSSLLVRRAIDQDRLIVAFSSTESDVLVDMGVEVPGLRFVNAKMVADEWRKRCRPAIRKQVAQMRRKLRVSRSPKQRERYWAKEGNRLIDYAANVGIKRPHMYRHRGVTRRLNDVMGQLQRRGAYGRLTRTAKAKWANVLRHNEFDVVGLSEMLGIMIREMWSHA